MCFTRRIHIYSCFGQEKYSAIVSKLATAGVPYTTKFINNNRSARGYSTVLDRTVQYDIYVKKEDEYKAQQAIHRN